MVALLEPSRVDDVDPTVMADHEIADELVALRREIDRMEARFARHAWAGHRRAIGTMDGSPSTQAWLRRHTGMRDGDARAAIETGSVSELLPTIGQAWRDGGITTGAVRTISAARVEKFCGASQYSAARAMSLGFQPPADAERALESTFRTEFASLPSRHAAADPKGLGFVRSGKHNPSADGDRLAAQRRVEQLLDRGIEGIEVRMEDGSCRSHPDRSPVVFRGGSRL